MPFSAAITVSAFLLSAFHGQQPAQDEKQQAPIIATSPAGQQVPGTDSPIIPYATLWVDSDGGSHVTSCTLHGMTLMSYAPPAQPQWLGIAPDDVESVTFAVLPVGYVGTWHHAPGPQWVVTLSGKWSIETNDGHVLVQGPGEAQFNADMADRPGPNGKIGHLTRTVGDQPNVQMIISLKRAPKTSFVGQSCLH